MIQFWKSLSANTQYSIIACIVAAILGLLSMGILGFALYYPVCFLFKNYPSINSWRGDWVWPATISVGIFWSLGFIFSGLAAHFLAKITSSKIIIYFVYGFILYLWAAILWYIVIIGNKDELV